MKVSIEISKYPLNEDYGNIILDFIHRLNEYPNIQVKTNSMSTQVFGLYDEVMSILQKEMKVSFKGQDTMIMVMKIINADLS